MRKSLTNHDLRQHDELATPARRFSLPAWALSTLLHAALLVIFGLSLRLAAPKGTTAETVRAVDVVLKHRSDEGDYYESKADEVAEAISREQGTNSRAPGMALDDPPPSDPTQALPKTSETLGPGALSQSLVSGAGQMTGGPAQPRTPTKGKARTKVFGIAGEGYKFVYVFDRSGSMGGSGRSPLESAKEELLGSLDDLDKTHQFQIIFYSERPIIFPLAGKRGRLVFGTEQNKQAAARFIRGIVADGPTRHEEALMAAIRMRPDVIFLLTDADEPSLTSVQLARIRRANSAATSINAIQFGLGPARGGINFLVQLAQQNGGRYAYIDISRFRPRDDRPR